MHRADSLEVLVQDVQHRVEKLEGTVKDSLELAENCVEAVRMLTEETVLARQIYVDGKSTARLFKTIWKPFVGAMIVAFFFTALAHYLIYGSWPEWYRMLVATLK